MRVFTSDELSRMRGTQDGAMQDQCVIQRYVAAQADDYGLGGQPSYSADAPIACGFKPASVHEIMDSTQVAVKAAELRLPIDTVIDNRDRIQITERFGETLLSPDVYRIIGQPKRGPSGLVLQLDTVTESSVIER